MDEIVKEFIAESREGLDQLDLDFIELEANPGNRATLDSVFRTVHTIKGSCGFLEYSVLEQVVHAGENLLVKLRDGQIKLNAECTNTLLAMVDVIRVQLDKISDSGCDGGDFVDLIQRLEEHAVLDSLDSVEAAKTVKAIESPGATTPVDANTPMAQHSLADLDADTRTLIEEFVSESIENLDRVDGELMSLELDPNQPDILASVFRTFHSIKGVSGFLEFKHLEHLTHIGENLLARLRDGSIQQTDEMSTALLAMTDATRALIGGIAEQGVELDTNHAALLNQLIALEQGRALEPTAEKTQVSTQSELPASGLSEQTVDGTQVSNESSSAGGANDKVSSEYKHKKPPIASAVDTSIRVDVPLLDSLMDLVGELVLARNQIVEFMDKSEESQIGSAAQRLDLITTELQEGVMQTRMQPIHSIWSRLPRVVRDLSRSCGKNILVEMQGKDTELDKSLIEAMKDPITHLVRNSVDHGIELPEKRLAAGKPEQGVLTLRAYHEGGQVHIEISDDGEGIDPEKIKRKAIEKGVITDDQALQMSAKEAGKLIFMPGFSTAEKVTNISGRGVGMDVVKTNIEGISGTIDLVSNHGQGTIFKIKVPLTLAIIPALIVSSGKERFAIPQVSLIELIRVDQEDPTQTIEFIQGCPVYRLRGSLLPLVRLNEELELKSGEEGTLNIIVLQAEACRFGLIVDQINDTQEIVVKPLVEVLKQVRLYAGATIMGDGRVALILDITGIGQRAGVMSQQVEKLTTAHTNSNEEHDDERQTFLLVRSSVEDRLAIKLDHVARLEQFSIDQIEHAGPMYAVQYRDQVLPLVPMAEVLGTGTGIDFRQCQAESREDGNSAKVVVFGEEDHQIGLVVEEIIDIVSETPSSVGKARRQGVSATVTVQGKITELFDVTEFDRHCSRVLNSNEMRSAA